MKYTIEYSKQAIRDMDRVWAEVFSSSKNYDTASRYLTDLLDTVERKTDFPKSGTPLYYDEIFTGYYFVIFKAYMAFYRIENKRVLVDRILYGKSDYLRHLYKQNSTNRNVLVDNKISEANDD